MMRFAGAVNQFVCGVGLVISLAACYLLSFFAQGLDANAPTVRTKPGPKLFVTYADLEG